MTDFTLHLGDCLETLKTLPDCSVDSVITDPPYGLSQHTPQQVADCLGAWLRGEEYKPKGKGFMGKSWDAWVPSPAVWRECLRVLKPGGHLLAFAGTRSMDLMSMAVRLAGFELRDSIGYAHDGGGAPLLAWAYGSGFPKSLDVSKAIDKRGGATVDFSVFKDRVREVMKARGISRKMLQETLGNFMLSHYLTDGSQPAIPNYRDYKIIRDTVGLGPEFDHLFREEAEREVIGKDTKARSTTGASALPTVGGDTTYQTWDITAPTTESAKQWQGWGTALKPAWEPIILARKPLDGTVAENVLAHGTGALNIDGCRVGAPDGVPLFSNRSGDSVNAYGDGLHGSSRTGDFGAGRWPANLIHDGSDKVLAAFPYTASGKAAAGGHRRTAENMEKGSTVYGGGRGIAGTSSTDEAGTLYGDSGSAARFFYCAKASKKDRDEGLGEFDKDTTDDGRNTPIDNPYLRGKTERANIHPTVKPTALMRYLCRLVTPPSGTVLDPFTGSGSTGKAAILEGFNFIGCELDPDYMTIAEARIRAACGDKHQELEAV